MHQTSMFFSNCVSSYDHAFSFRSDLHVKMNPHQSTQYFYPNSIILRHPCQAKSLYWNSDSQLALMSSYDTGQLNKSLCKLSFGCQIINNISAVIWRAIFPGKWEVKHVLSFSMSAENIITPNYPTCGTCIKTCCAKSSLKWYLKFLKKAL